MTSLAQLVPCRPRILQWLNTDIDDIVYFGNKPLRKLWPTGYQLRVAQRRHCVVDLINSVNHLYFHCLYWAFLVHIGVLFLGQ